jgi:hypothetical protein
MMQDGLYKAFITWNLRNFSTGESTLTSPKYGVAGTVECMFPIDAWTKSPISIPKNYQEINIDARQSGNRTCQKKSSIINRRRICQFPLYLPENGFDVNILKSIIRHWGELCLPNDLPCMAIALKCYGNYSRERVGQYVTVMLIWHDQTAQIISLDWFEGPLEDCITPEWYINVDSPETLQSAFEKIKEFCKESSWENSYFSMFCIPQSLGSKFRGERNNASYPIWNSEWRYVSGLDVKKDLEQFYMEINKIFVENTREVK